MYPEFVPIYIGLVITIALLAVILIVLLKNKSGAQTTKVMTTQTATPPAAGSVNVVFCKNCAAEFDASQRACPRCGTPR